MHLVKNQASITGASIVLSLCLALAGCGGGGSSTAATSTTTVTPAASGSTTTTATTTTSTSTDSGLAYKSVPTALPDLNAETSDLCDSSGANSVFALTFADLNKDGRQDIITQIYCFITPGTVYSGPTKNTLITLLGQADGTFRLGNLELFGTRRVDLGGFNRKAKVYDINGDGYPDIAMSINKEDGRANGTVTDMNAMPTIMMSDSTGKYSIKTLGQGNWMHHVDILPTSAGVDVFFAGFNSGLQVFRFNGNSYADVSAQYPSNLSGSSFLFLSPTSILSDYIYTSATPGMSQVLLDKTASAWQRDAEYAIPSTTITYLTWTAQLAQAPMFQFAGMNIAGGAFPSQCLLKLRPTEGPIVLSQLNGTQVTNYTAGTPVSQSALPSVNYVAAFQVSGNSVSLIDQLVQGQNTTTQWFQMHCRDINGDGYDDLVAEPTNNYGLPHIYLNNKSGNLVALDTSAFPKNSSNYTIGALEDLDGDAIPDLVQISSNSYSSYFRVYWGNKLLN